MALDSITERACRTVNAPVSLVTVLGRDHQHFLSVKGLPEPWASRRCTPIEMSFCRHVVLGNAPLSVDFTRGDPRFRDHPAVEALNVVSYLGVPLRGRGETALGALCVIDVSLRRWSAADRDRLSALASEIAERDLLGGGAG